MSRKPHKWRPNAIMHITARGNRKNNIFLQQHDYNLYLYYIKEALGYFDNKFIILSYALMSNHVHLEIQTKDVDISKFIQRVHSRYAETFNILHNYVGHLFQDRYWSEIIEDDAYLLEVSRYIHMNPVKANMVENPEDYKWSSFNMYLHKDKEKIIKTDKILSFFPNDDKLSSREKYKLFVLGK